jgi:uncharacterized protein (DUF433 family)
MNGAVVETNQSVIRNSRGLSIAGTRITLYHLLDYLKADWPPQLIQDRLNLTSKQMADALAYLDAHREQVEAEYQLVLQQAEDVKHYWQEHNRERLAQIAALPPKPGQEEIHAKLQAWKRKLEAA